MRAENPRRAEDTAWRTVDGEMIIVSAGSGRITALNATGALVWELADGSNAVETIVDAVCREFEVEHDAARADVRAFLEDLEAEGLAESGTKAISA